MSALAAAEAHQISLEIYAILDAYRKNPNQLNYDGTQCVSQILSFVEQSKSVTCLFPACHGKVDNADLLIDHRADLSEYLCVDQLVKMNDEVRAIYPPGLDVFMVHEGHFYVDTGLIRSDESMDAYLEDVRRLTSRHPFIHSLSLREFYPELSSAAEARAAFLEQYCSADVDVDSYGDMVDYYAARLRNLFGAIDYARYGDYADFEDFVVGKAREQLSIWIGFRRMLADKFGPANEYVRFSSVYKGPDVVDQIALNHLPEHHLEMPSFYSVYQRPDGGFGYLTKAAAVEHNYQVSEVEGYRYFVPGPRDDAPAPVDRIMDIVESYRKNPFGEIFDNSVVREKIAQRVAAGQPIPFVLPGFHGKTDNPDFVFGPSVDMGDKVALDNLTEMLDAVKAAYDPGAVLHIVHECHFYVGRSPLVGSRRQLDTYLHDFRAMIGGRTDVVSVSIYEMMHGPHTFQDKLATFFADYCPSIDEVGDYVASSAHHRSLYTSYKKVNEVHQNRDPRFALQSRRLRKQRIKDLASVQMQIVFGFGALIKSHFADTDYVRLSSLYKGPEFTDCVAVNYLPGTQHMSTPTFNCLVRTQDGRYDFIRKADADAQGDKYVLSEDNGLKYFEAVS
jgi:L-tyrosine isonitrile synthase